jgi:hypothetical protein
MTAPDLTPVPLSPERLAEIKDLLKYESSIAFYSSRAKESMLLLVAEAEEAARLRADRAQVVAEVQRFGIYGSATTATKALVERASELVDENARLKTRVGELEASLPSRFASTPLQVEQHLTGVLAEDVHLRYQQAIGSYAVGEAAKSLRMDANLRQLEGNHEEAAEARELANLIDPLKGGGPYPSALVRFGCGAEVTS